MSIDAKYNVSDGQLQDILPPISSLEFHHHTKQQNG